MSCDCSEGLVLFQKGGGGGGRKDENSGANLSAQTLIMGGFFFFSFLHGREAGGTLSLSGVRDI